MPRKGNGRGDADLTVAILREIRDEIRTTNQRLDATREELSQRLDTTREELGQRIDETNRRIVESEVRLATAVTDLRQSVVEVRDLLKEQLDLRHRVERLERHVGLAPDAG
jgi:predicted  nucleic acid-binding Zn-ribbon protein